MRKSRFTETQIVAVLKELDAGTSATELGRKHHVHANTIIASRSKYAGLEASDLMRLKQLEDESNRKRPSDRQAYARGGSDAGPDPKKRLGLSHRECAVRAL